MALTVTPNLTDISLCDDTTNWSDGDVDTDWKMQGSGCLALQVKATTSTIITYTFGSPVDMTGKHLYIWMMVAGIADTKANGGLRIYVETDGGNYGTWYVGGGDVQPQAIHPGGWGCYCIDPASTPTTGTGTINPASIAKIGVQFKTLSSVVGQAKNCFWDACRYGTGLTITSGVSDAITFEDIFTEDNNSNNKYGVITKGSGSSYVIQGNLVFGGTGAENIDFVDISKICIFPDNDFVSTSFYGIEVLAGSGVINFALGEKSGISGISGCLLKAPGNRQFSLDFSNTNIDKLGLYGSTFDGASAITLLPNTVNREVLNCNFIKCGETIADTCIIDFCNFISSLGRAIKISSASHNVTNSQFIGCQTAIHHDVGGSEASPLEYDYDNLQFSGNTYDIENSASSPNYYIDIDRLNGSNPSDAKINNSNGGTTTILPISVILTLIGLQTGSEVRIYEAGTTTELDGIEDSGTTFNYSYEYVEGAKIDIVVHHLSYLYYRLENYELGMTNASFPVVQQSDRQYANP